MTLGTMWKGIAARVLDGERNDQALSGDASAQILGDREMTVAAVGQFVSKRVKDMIAAAVKPTGATSRVPAGQQDLGWLGMEPVLAIDRLRRQIRLAYAAAARAANHAQVLGIIDASGLEPSAFETFRELCAAAHVPNELADLLAA